MEATTCPICQCQHYVEDERLWTECDCEHGGVECAIGRGRFRATNPKSVKFGVGRTWEEARRNLEARR